MPISLRLRGKHFYTFSTPSLAHILQITICYILYYLLYIIFFGRNGCQESQSVVHREAQSRLF